MLTSDGAEQPSAQSFLPTGWSPRRIAFWAGLLAVVVGLLLLPLAEHVDRARGSRATDRADGKVVAVQTVSLRNGDIHRVVVRWTHAQGGTTSTRFRTESRDRYRVGQQVQVWYAPRRADGGVYLTKPEDHRATDAATWLVVGGAMALALLGAARLRRRRNASARAMDHPA